MTDSPDRTPPSAEPGRSFGEAVPRPSGPPPLFRDDPSGPGGEEPTRVHATAPGAGQDTGGTGSAPAPAPPSAAPGTTGATPAPAAAPAAAPETAPAAGAPAEPRKVSVRNRGRMRRRLRYLRRVRELGYRDLGGLVFELRRARVENEVLVGAKVDALHAIDRELHVLEHGLRDHRSVEELYEPGVSVCLRCGALHGSDANFCPQCGIRVDGQGVPAAAAEPATVVPGPAPAPGSTGTVPAPGGQPTGREPR
jgi:hypothetical protein